MKKLEIPAGNCDKACPYWVTYNKGGPLCKLYDGCRLEHGATSGYVRCEDCLTDYPNGITIRKSFES